jgi:hexosaminidase
MKKLSILFLSLATTLTTLAGNTVKRTSSIDIIPLPAQMTVGDKNFVLKVYTPIVLAGESPGLEPAAEFLNRSLSPIFGSELPVVDAPVKGGRSITMRIGPSIKAEAYRMTVSTKGIDIEAGSPAGAFYACQTLLQLCPATIINERDVKAVEIPCVVIEDAPAFDIRGMLLDVSRHFFTVEEIKVLLDILAMHKINTFHWHLTDDQGWRIEIKKYPELTRVGSYRPYTTVANTLTPDNVPYEGYYTQEQRREVVAYAAERFITVIPEIDIPGHSTAALASYQWLGCKGEGYSVWCKWGISKDVYCAGKESTFEFLEGVLSEVLEMFPSEYIHIGGDECPKDSWKECPLCQARIEAEGLKDEKELQSYVMQRVEKFVTAHGRKIMGWDEIGDGGLSSTATVTSRYSHRTGDFLKQGNDVILCPGRHCYFDYYQDKDHSKEPLAHRFDLPIEQVYEFEPGREFSESERKQILGIQCNLWTERIPNFSHAQYMLLPRLDAFSDVAWSLAPRDYEKFRSRVKTMAERYDALGYRYATHIFR